jgi:multimeric flavodoxin WrbA
MFRWHDQRRTVKLNMDILGIVGSMRKNRLTYTLVKRLFDEIKVLRPSTTVETLYTADLAIHPCRVTCSAHCVRHPFQCSIDDDLSGVLERMIEADVLILGTPLYFRAPPAQFQIFAERLISMFFFQETQGGGNSKSPLFGKPCGLVAVTEYSNPQMMLEYLHDFCSVLGMRPVLLTKFPYLGVGSRGNIEKDTTFAPLERVKELAAALSATTTEV